MTKLIVIGDVNVGKTHIIRKYTTGDIPYDASSTLCIEFTTFNIPLQDGGLLKSEIWDTAGEEKYMGICYLHFRNADGVLIIYGLDNEQSFQNAPAWLNVVKTNCPANIPITLVGNKYDLVSGINEPRREVALDVAQKFAEEYGMKHIEVSAVTGHNINKVFEDLGERIWEMKTDCVEPSRTTLDLNNAINAIDVNDSCCSFM